MSPAASQEITSIAVRQLPCALSPVAQLWWVNLDLYASKAHTRDAVTDHDGGDAVVTLTQRRVQTCHHALRDVLAEHYGCNTNSEDFSRNAFGKPLLQRDPSLHFSISHAEMHGLIGVCVGSAIGVDIERLQTVTDEEMLAAEHFTASEHAAYLQRDEQWGHRFLTCWTRKEACGKALGAGLAIPPKLLDVGCSTEPRSVRIPVGSEWGELVVTSVQSPGDSIAAVSLAPVELVARVERAYRHEQRRPDRASRSPDQLNRFR